MGSKVKVWKWRSLSHVRLFATPRNSPWNSPGQNTGVSGLSLLQGIFPTQGSNPGLPHCRQILYQLSHKGSMGSKAACQRIDLSYFILVWLYDEGWRVLKKKKNTPGIELISRSNFKSTIQNMSRTQTLPYLPSSKTLSSPVWTMANNLQIALSPPLSLYSLFAEQIF